MPLGYKTAAPIEVQVFQTTLDSRKVCLVVPAIIKDTRISKTVSEVAALSVLKTHRMSFSGGDTRKTLITSSVANENGRVPGRPQPFRSMDRNYKEDEVCESRVERFRCLLSGTPTLIQLRNLSWSGVPSAIRAVTWRLLLKYLPMNRKMYPDVLNTEREDYWSFIKQYYDYYTTYVEKYRATYRQIHIDVPRTNPTIPLFQQEIVQRMFERILFTWAIRHPKSGYVQGINDLVTPFFIVFLQEVIPDKQFFELLSISSLSQQRLDIIEADSFWCISKFLIGVQDNYIFAQPGIRHNVDQLKQLIQRVDKALHQHLVKHNVDYIQFSFRWFNNLLTRELPLRCIIRLWDTYLAENDSLSSFQVYVCAAFLLYWREQLLQQIDFQGLMLLLQNLPTQNWTGSHVALLVAEAYRLEYMFADAPNHLKSDNCNR